MKHRDTQEIAATTLETPIGALRLEATPRGLCRIDFAAGAPSSAPAEKSHPAPPAAQEHLERARRQLREYFAGRRRRFHLPLDLTGTAHQRRVWEALLGIPYGRTLSYADVGTRLGSPRAARAVGRACATNPVPVVVPCHRVVGGDGALHGYGGGLWRKRLLLDLERRRRPASAPLDGTQPA